jgi:hypothetical protein
VFLTNLGRLAAISQHTGTAINFKGHGIGCGERAGLRSGGHTAPDVVGIGQIHKGQAGIVGNRVSEVILAKGVLTTATSIQGKVVAGHIVIPKAQNRKIGARQAAGGITGCCPNRAAGAGTGMLSATRCKDS